jgi:hypothetical protein
MKPFNGSGLYARDHAIVGHMPDVLHIFARIIIPLRNTGITSATRPLGSAKADVERSGCRFGRYIGSEG